MGIKPSTSLKQILESGQVLKVDLWEIRVIAPLLFDFLFSNSRFESQSDVI